MKTKNDIEVKKTKIKIDSLSVLVCCIGGVFLLGVLFGRAIVIGIDLFFRDYTSANFGNFMYEMGDTFYVILIFAMGLILLISGIVDINKIRKSRND